MKIGCRVSTRQMIFTKGIDRGNFIFRIKKRDNGSPVSLFTGINETGIFRLEITLMHDNRLCCTDQMLFLVHAFRKALFSLPETLIYKSGQKVLQKKMLIRKRVGVLDSSVQSAYFFTSYIGSGTFISGSSLWH